MELKDIKGIGPVKIKKLENLGIFNIKDLIYHFPYRYVDRQKELKVIDVFLMDNENYHCIGTLDKINMIRLSKGRQITNAVISDDTGNVTITWFNNPYIIVNFKVGDKVIFSGKIEKKKLINPKIRKINSDEDIENFSKIEAIYPETRGIKSNLISAFVKNALPDFLQDLKDKLPKRVRQKESLLDIADALMQIHFPNDLNEVEDARKRLAFDEIYRILKLVKLKKDKIKKFNSYKIIQNDLIDKQLLHDLPFELTETQNTSIQEIYNDLSSSIPMHRLLNGDVGSGKTIVASLAAAQVLNHGAQVIFLAPTGVLAKQHYDFLNEFFTKLHFKTKVHLVTSNTRSEIKKLEKELKDYESNEIFIGTHALLFHFDLFKNVGLVIIDEQHKFGVVQRELLEQLALHASPQNPLKLPHVLSMSATPIPRSLALTLYGDLDVSILQKPIERKNIVTRTVYDEEILEKMYLWIENQIRTKKAQVYVVCPLIEDSEKLDSKSVIREYENLKKRYAKFNLALLHGKLKPKEKDEILESFIEGKIDILVSTSVIEVGINNPNATIMIIEGAERFGLAQLHQIRGRVGRSEKQSYCFLKTSDLTPNKRIDFFAENNDGFAIAEYDLQSRGPGELYGKTQSGLPKLRIASIFDIDFIKKVKEYVK